MRDTLNRVKQFLKGLTAFGYNKCEILDKYLNSKERELFLKLPAHERRHAIETANTIQEYNIEKNKNVLIKAALLHDIGKSEGKIGIIKKSIMVLMDKFIPHIAYKLSNKLNMFDVYYNHPMMGAILLNKTDTEQQVIMLVKFHHSDKSDEIKGMELLKKADSLN